MKCLACHTEIKYKGELLTCTICKGSYHYGCNNITTAHFNQHANDIRKTWKCPSKKCSRPARKDDNTPIRTRSSAKELSPVGESEKNEVSNVEALPLCQDDTPIAAVEGDHAAFPEKSMHCNNAQCSKALQDFHRLISDLSVNMKTLAESLGACRNDIASFRSELSSMTEKIERLEHYESEVQDLRGEVHKLRTEIINRDRQHVQNNIEIVGLTEQGGENLDHLVGVIATKLGVDLDTRDIAHICRVGRRQPQDTAHPRPVVLRLTRRAVRDQLLKAARVRRHLSTEQLGVPGNSRAVYINEHLIKSDRQLYGKARGYAREGKLKYVWRKNGQILIRKSENGPVCRIQSEGDLLDVINGDTPKTFRVQ